jgi:hypothetical protein
MYKYSASDSALTAAVSSVAHANYARRFKYNESEQIALSNYTRALNLMKKIMEKPHEAKQDETMATMTLLGFYEVRTSFYLVSQLTSSHSY